MMEEEAPKDFLRVEAHNFMSQFARDEELDDALEFIRSVKSTFQGQQGKFDEFSRRVQEITASRLELDGQNKFVGFKDIPVQGLETVKAMLQGQGLLICIFDTFLPPHLRSSLDQNKAGTWLETTNNTGVKDSIQFLEKVKKRDERLYKEFLDVYLCNKMKSGKIQDLSDQVVRIFAGHPDLIQEFGVSFMPITDATPLSCVLTSSEGGKGSDVSDSGAAAVADSVQQKKAAGEKAVDKVFQQGVKFFKKIQRKLSAENYLSFLKYFFLYKDEKIRKDKLEKVIEDMIGQDADLMDELKNFFKMCENLSGTLEKLEGRRSEKRNRNGKKEADKQEGSGVESEDGGFSQKPSRKRRHKQETTAPEVHRSEMDVLLTSLRSAVKYAEGTFKGMKENDIEGGKKADFLRCIQTIYGWRSREVLRHFEKEPEKVMLSALPRFKAKLEDYEGCRADSNKIWNTVYAENFCKSGIIFLMTVLFMVGRWTGNRVARLVAQAAPTTT